MLGLSGFVVALALAVQPPELVGGYVVGVSQRSEEPSILSQGVADRENNIAADETTVFHIASLSKQITAAALAKAILDGKASLDDPLSDHIPEAKHYGDELTLAHLVYFTSGLTEAYSLEREGGIPWTTHYHFTVDEAIATSLSVPTLEFRPGSQWRYNNINYQLIAEVVERAYGKPFSQVVREKIFEPLGMSASLIHDDVTTIVPNRADGVIARVPEVVSQLRSTGVYVAEEGGPILIRRNAPHYGGSGVLTSMADWLKWQDELLTHEALGDEFWSLMVRTQTFDHPKDNDAFGLVHAEFEGHAALWFSGGDIDASSHMVALPNAGVSATCFSNQPGFDCRGEVAKALREALKD